MSESIIQVKNVSKQYLLGLGGGERYRTLRDIMSYSVSALFRRKSACGENNRERFMALNNISFDLRKGEVLGIIGRNGAGKSTLLKILSRITEPTEGEIYIRGRVASLLEVGTGFHAELSGRENIFLNGAILGMRQSEIRRKFDEIVAFAEVDKFIDTPVKRYSSGMYVRLAFAVAAHLEPEILLVDEVLAVGDMAFQKKCLGKMGEVSQQEGRTVVFVSHNMASIQRLCSRVILLDGGLIIEDGHPNHVIDLYLSQGVEKKGERTWEQAEKAPGSESVRLKAIRVMDTKGRAIDCIDVKEAVVLEMEYWVLKPIANLAPSFYLNNEMGVLVFVTADVFGQGGQNEVCSVGLYRSRCHIPANLLNEGTIFVLAALSDQTVCHVREREAISFRVVDDMQKGGARGMYHREWPGGVIRPLLKWETKCQIRE